MRWVLDERVRRIDGGRVLLGGSPLRFLRLSPAGVAALADVEADRVAVPGPFVDRLVERGLLHPVLDPSDPADRCDPTDLTVVIPVRDRADALDRCLAALALRPVEESDAHGARNLHGRAGLARPGPIAMIVVDDGSSNAAAHAAVASRRGARLLRLDRSLGPAAARNAGLAAVVTPFVAFVDSDVTIDADALCRLAGHLADPAVALVAPRVGHRNGGGVLDRYESVASSLDLGARAAPIQPRSRVAYVPAAAMVVRAESLRALRGFDESLTVGEDVDLCWRLDAAGHRCRYEPSITAHHDGRSTMGSWLARLRQYGTSAAPLDERHPGNVAPVVVSPWSVGVWSAGATGHPLAAALGVIASGELLARKLTFLRHPRREAYRLVGAGHLGAGRLFGQALIRPYWPVTVMASLVSRRVRRIVPLAVVIPVLMEYRERRPALDPLRWSALRLADHVAYSTGVWQGAWRRRRFGALRPAGARN